MATRKATRKPAVKKKAAAKKPAVKRAAAKKAAPRKAAPRKAAPKKAAPTKAVAAQRAADDMMKLAGVGSEAVMKATGKAWEDWLKVLDKAGAVNLPHKDIAGMLGDKFGVPGWWQQMVAVGYEQARGLRAVHQKAEGFSASASKTFQSNLEKIYKAWNDPQLREVWLPGAPLQVRRSTDGKSMRITWTLGNSNVDVGFYSKGPDKTVVQIEHSKLSGEEAVQAQKAYWSSGLERLNAWLAAARPQ
jgi:hypothetical protein